MLGGWFAAVRHYSGSASTDYYYAVTYDDSAPDDHTDVVGKDTYYEIWFGHRMTFVRAGDVTKK